MSRKTKIVALLLAGSLWSVPGTSAARKGKNAREASREITANGVTVLWRNPTDIAFRNLFYGPGGKRHQPPRTFTFLKEDLDGTNPKYIVQDRNGVKWKIKLGAEARPETAASRLVWAAGYYANEDYFLPDLRVREMPSHLHRRQKLVGPDGSMHDARLKRYLPGEKKVGSWRWRQDPFSGTRELNGLRVLMVLINNWDVKDENNAVYQETPRARSAAPELIYAVSDLGASFGWTGRLRHAAVGKGNLDLYRRSKFIRRITPEYVDFETPTRPALVCAVDPKDFFKRVHLRWIGRQIPRADARWMGQLLARLSAGQIRDAFRAAGYAPREADGFAEVVEARIAELRQL